MRKIIPLTVTLVVIAFFFIFLAIQQPEPVAMDISTRIPKNYTGRESISLVIESHMPKGETIDFKAGQLYQYILEHKTTHVQQKGAYDLSYSLNPGEVFQAQIMFDNLMPGEYTLTVTSQPEAGNAIKSVTTLEVSRINEEELYMIASSVLGDFNAYRRTYQGLMDEWLKGYQFTEEDLSLATEALIRLQQKHEALDFMYLGLEDWSKLDMANLTSEFEQRFMADETNDLATMIMALEKGFICYPSFYSDAYKHQERGWYMQGIQKSDFYWNSTYVDAFTMERIGGLAKRVTSSGQVLGVVGMDLDLTELEGLMGDYETRYNVLITIAKSSGAIYYRTDEPTVTDLTELEMGIITEGGLHYYGPNGAQGVFHLKEAKYTSKDEPEWSIYVEYKK